MKPKRFLVTFSQPVAIPANGGVIMTPSLIVESPIVNAAPEPPREVAKGERWSLMSTNSFRAVAYTSGKLAKPIDCLIGSYNTIAFAVELPDEEAT